MGALIRNIVEIGFGVVFLVGAVFNSVFTFSHGEEFFGGFADNALLKPAGRFVETVVVPNARLFTVLIIAVQLLAAIFILSRGALVKPGLLIGAAFAFGAAFVSNGPGAAANLSMAAALGWLAYTH